MKTILFPPGIFLLLATAFGASGQSLLPDGPNKDLVELVCSKCHTTDRIASKAMTKAEWKEEVAEMLQEEDDVTEAEKDQIIEYLSKYFPAKDGGDKQPANDGEDKQPAKKEPGKEEGALQCFSTANVAVIDQCNLAQDTRTGIARADQWEATGSLGAPDQILLSLSAYALPMSSGRLFLDRVGRHQSFTGDRRITRIPQSLREKV